MRRQKLQTSRAENSFERASWRSVAAARVTSKLGCESVLLDSERPRPVRSPFLGESTEELGCQYVENLEQEDLH